MKMKMKMKINTLQFVHYEIFKCIKILNILVRIVKIHYVLMIWLVYDWYIFHLKIISINNMLNPFCYYEH